MTSLFAGSVIRMPPPPPAAAAAVTKDEPSSSSSSAIENGTDISVIPDFDKTSIVDGGTKTQAASKSACIESFFSQHRKRQRGGTGIVAAPPLQKELGGTRGKRCGSSTRPNPRAKGRMPDEEEEEGGEEDDDDDEASAAADSGQTEAETALVLCPRSASAIPGIVELARSISEIKAFGLNVVLQMVNHVRACTLLDEDRDILAETYRAARMASQTTADPRIFGFRPAVFGGPHPMDSIPWIVRTPAAAGGAGGAGKNSGRLQELSELAVARLRAGGSAQKRAALSLTLKRIGAATGRASEGAGGLSRGHHSLPRKIVHQMCEASPITYIDSRSCLCFGQLPRQSASLNQRADRQEIEIISTYSGCAVEIPIQDVVGVVCKAVPRAPPSTYKQRARYDDLKDMPMERRYPKFCNDSDDSGLLAVRLCESDAMSASGEAESFRRRLEEDVSDTYIDRVLRKADPAGAPAPYLPTSVVIENVFILEGDEPELVAPFRGLSRRIHPDFFVTALTEDPAVGAEQLQGHLVAVISVTPSRDTTLYAHRLAARDWRVMCPDNVEACIRQSVFDLKWSSDLVVFEETRNTLEQSLNEVSRGERSESEQRERARNFRKVDDEDETEEKRKHRLYDMRIALVAGETSPTVPSEVPEFLGSDLPGSARYFYSSSEKQRSRHSWVSFASHVFVHALAEIASQTDVSMRDRDVIERARSRLRDVFEPLRSYLHVCAEVMAASVGSETLVVPNVPVEKVKSHLRYHTSQRMPHTVQEETANVVYWMEVHADPETMPIRDVDGKPASLSILRSIAESNLRYGQLVQSTRRYEFHVKPKGDQPRITKTKKEGEDIIHKIGKQGGAEYTEEGRNLKAMFLEIVGYGPDIRQISKYLKKLNHQVNRHNGGRPVSTPVSKKENRITPFLSTI